MQATGLGGELRHGYRVAAGLGEWLLDIQTRPTRLIEAVVTVRWTDETWLGERPLDLALHIGSATWVWRNIEPSWRDGRMRVTLRDRPETREWAAEPAEEIAR